MTTREKTTVVGVFRDRNLAEQTATALRQMGWDREHMQLIGRSTGGTLTSRNKATTEQPSMADAAALDAIDMPGELRQIYQRELEAGAAILTVRAPDHPLEARDILQRHGATNIFVPTETDGEHVIQLRREEAAIQKQVVAVGEIRIHKTVITENKTFTVPVTREEITIERIPHSQATTAPDNAATQTTAGDLEEETLAHDGTVRIFVHEEQVIIQKQPVVVEEIVIHKQTIQDTKQISEALKREEIHIERNGTVPMRSNSAEMP